MGSGQTWPGGTCALQIRREARGLKFGSAHFRYSPSILDAARQAITASKVHQLSNSNDTPLSWKEALALATLGGAQALGVDANIGNFVVGKAFDALVVDTAVTSSPFDVQDADSLEDMVSKFVFLGDDRNIVAVYVNGVNCLPTCIPC